MCLFTGLPDFCFVDEENILRSVLEVKQKYALNAAMGQLHALVKPSDIGKDGGSSAMRSVRQVYNYLSLNGGSHLKYFRTHADNSRIAPSCIA